MKECEKGKVSQYTASDPEKGTWAKVSPTGRTINAYPPSENSPLGTDSSIKQETPLRAFFPEIIMPKIRS